ncbi:MAG TPA: hypothetical protein VK479_02290 [Micropepsaceae bacterium]|nr:hypothetical protein [Micropepsaceae bacterium]
MGAIFNHDRMESVLRVESDLLAFLAEFPLKKKWLDEIAEFLLTRPNGTAHVSEITRALEATPRDVSSVQGLVYTTLASFCSDRRDFDKAADYDLFARLELGTYRLRSFPHPPDTLDVQRIEFQDKAMTHVWREFSTAAQQRSPAWRGLKNRARLIVFASEYRENAALRDQYESWWSRYRRHEEGHLAVRLPAAASGVVGTAVGGV